MSKSVSHIIQAVSALSLIAWIVLSPRVGATETSRFSAQELENQQANWTPQDVVIDRSHDTEAGVLFVLDNPTTRTHAFEAPGVLEQIVAGNREVITRTLRITVAPGETVEVGVRFAQGETDPDAQCADGASCYLPARKVHRSMHMREAFVE